MLGCDALVSFFSCINLLDDARGKPFTKLFLPLQTVLECLVGFGHAWVGITAKHWECCCCSIGWQRLFRSGMSLGESVPFDENEVAEEVGDGGEVGEKVDGEEQGRKM